MQFAGAVLLGTHPLARSQPGRWRAPVAVPVGTVSRPSSVRQGFAAPLRALDRLPPALRPRLWGRRPLL